MLIQQLLLTSDFYFHFRNNQNYCYFHYAKTSWKKYINLAAIEYCSQIESYNIVLLFCI